MLDATRSHKGMVTASGLDRPKAMWPLGQGHRARAVNQPLVNRLGFQAMQPLSLSCRGLVENSMALGWIIFHDAELAGLWYQHLP